MLEKPRSLGFNGGRFARRGSLRRGPPLACRHVHGRVRMPDRGVLVARGRNIPQLGVVVGEFDY